MNTYKFIVFYVYNTGFGLNYGHRTIFYSSKNLDPLEALSLLNDSNAVAITGITRQETEN
jgi:hypothetical protein